MGYCREKMILWICVSLHVPNHVWKAIIYIDNFLLLESCAGDNHEWTKICSLNTHPNFLVSHLCTQSFGNLYTAVHVQWTPLKAFMAMLKVPSIYHWPLLDLWAGWLQCQVKMASFTQVFLASVLSESMTGCSLAFIFSLAFSAESSHFTLELQQPASPNGKINASVLSLQILISVYRPEGCSTTSTWSTIISKGSSSGP